LQPQSTCGQSGTDILADDQKLYNKLDLRAVQPARTHRTSP